jgi:hypothetical protein
VIYGCDEWQIDACESLLPIDLVSHDIVEIVSSDKTVFVEVGLAEHVVEVIFSEVFS